MLKNGIDIFEYYENIWNTGNLISNLNIRIEFVVKYFCINELKNIINSLNEQNKEKAYNFFKNYYRLILYFFVLISQSLIFRRFLAVTVVDDFFVASTVATFGFDDVHSISLEDVLVGLNVTLGAILLIVPGIMAAIGLMFANYVLIDNEKLRTTEILKKAWTITNGHKMDLFMLGLSFFGWYLLGVLTCGIAFIYVIPYVKTTTTKFLYDIKVQNEK